MTKHKFLILFLLTGIVQASGQFNPGAAEKSLVKIIVSQSGNPKAAVSTGFIWRQNSWIVTSLHVMKPGGTVQVVYPGSGVRNAQVIKVLQEADLVLLETNIDVKPLTSDVTAITSFHQGGLTFQEKIYAIGYNGGSKGDQTQALEKGHANPETLEFLVRAEDVASLKQVGFPSMSLPIYFLAGSLLPGFSGSPVYNQKNELIGIGDGGLERGMMNVSWCIPASNLIALENSSVTSLPANLSKAGQLYSAEVSIELPKEENNNSNSESSGFTDEQIEDLSLQADTMYGSFTHGDFSFYQTKTRTWKEMEETSINPDNMERQAQRFENRGIHLGYDYLIFDVYDDINYGFSIALPEGTKLEYSEADNEFYVNFDEFEEGKYFGLSYNLIEHSGDPVGEAIKILDDGWNADVHGFRFDTAYSYTIDLNEEWIADYRKFYSNTSYFDSALNEQVGVLYYLNVIHNKDMGFYSLAVCLQPVNRTDLNEAYKNGIDCNSDYDKNTTVCDFLETTIKVIAAANLTTISSLY